VHQRIVRNAALACSLVPLCAVAQTAPAPAVLPPVQSHAIEAAPLAPANVAVAPVCADCVTIPALTPIRIELLAEMGSKLSKTGQMFPIKLAYPIMIDGKTIVPAGVTGMGEVIFAKGSGGGGAGGELVLAARYLDIGDKRLRLRSLVVNGNGKSRIDSANTVGIAISGIAAMFMKGKQSLIPAGTIADAKTAEAFSIAPGSVSILEATTGPQAGPAIVPTPATAAAPAVVPASAGAPSALQQASQEKGK